LGAAFFFYKIARGKSRGSCAPAPSASPHFWVIWLWPWFIPEQYFSPPSPSRPVVPQNSADAANFSATRNNLPNIHLLLHAFYAVFAFLFHYWGAIARS
jgi:hypothetical protein